MMMSNWRMEGAEERRMRNGGCGWSAKGHMKHGYQSQKHNNRYLDRSSLSGAAGGTTASFDTFAPNYKSKYNYDSKKAFFKPYNDSKNTRDPGLCIRPDPSIADAPLVLDDIATMPIFEEGRVFQLQYGERIRVRLPITTAILKCRELQGLESSSGVCEREPRVSAPAATSEVADLLGPIDTIRDARSMRANIISSIRAKTANKSSGSSNATDSRPPSSVSAGEDSDTSFRTAETTATPKHKKGSKNKKTKKTKNNKQKHNARSNQQEIRPKTRDVTPDVPLFDPEFTETLIYSDVSPSVTPPPPVEKPDETSLLLIEF